MGWLDDYVNFAKNNEAPGEFHWWVGATILGAAMKNQVLFKRGYYELAPNLWVILVAASGEKKTSACTIGHTLLTRLDHVKITADKSSPEGLALSLGEAEDVEGIESQALIYAPELAHFLDRRNHSDGLVQFLLRMADCPKKWIYKTKSSGSIYLKNVATSFLGATTGELLRESVPPLALKTGFLARFLTVGIKPGAPKVVPFPFLDPEREMQLFNSLYELTQIRGEMQMPKSAWKWFYEWYTYLKTQVIPTANGRMQAYYNRKSAHLLRLAMIVSLSRDRRTAYSVAAFEEALEHIDLAEAQLEGVYADLEASIEGQDTLGVLLTIRNLGGVVAHSKLLRRYISKMTSDKFRKYMDTLTESGYILRERSPKGGIVYKLKESNYDS